MLTTTPVYNLCIKQKCVNWHFLNWKKTHSLLAFCMCCREQLSKRTTETLCDLLRKNKLILRFPRPFEDVSTHRESPCNNLTLWSVLIRLFRKHNNHSALSSLIKIKHVCLLKAVAHLTHPTARFHGSKHCRDPGVERACSAPSNKRNARRSALGRNGEF